MNQKEKSFARNNGVYLWQVADAMGISEPTLTRKLRRTLTDSDHEAFIAAVKKIVESRNEGC